MYSIYEVKNNETFKDISNKLNISVEELKILNDNIDSIIQGQLIIIPNKSNYFIHVVKKGENLYNISKKYDVDVRSILLLNGLKDNEYIYPEQKLMIPKSNIYITKENETLNDLINSGISLKELLNNKIYLQNEQVIFYKKD